MVSEEDIKILEEEIKRVHKINDLSGTYVPINILENLLQGYKELKQNSIPKSLVEEKIEENNKKYKEIEAKYTEEELDNGEEGLDDYIEMQKIQEVDNVLYELLKGGN